MSKGVFDVAINIQDLASEINRQLAQYANTLSEDVQKAAQEVAKEGVKRLKLVSPERTGDYAKSWAVKKVKGKFVVHNKEHYRLTHLLENGHAKAGGGRVPAKVHIKPVETEMIQEFEQKVMEAARR